MTKRLKEPFFIKIVFLLGIVSSSLHAFGAREIHLAQLEEPLYQEVRHLTQKVLEICPPQECFYVGVGRSPTPVMALMELLFPENLVTLPLTYFRYDYPGASHSERGRYFLSKIQEQRLRLHLKRFLPSPEDLKNKKLLLIDFAITGESLLSASYFVRKHVDLSALTLAFVSSEDALFDPEAIDVKIKLLSDYPELYSSFAMQMFDGLAKYGQYKISSPFVQFLKPRDEYREFQSHFLRFLEKDTVFLEWLKSFHLTQCEVYLGV
jgi:hypothetical protein